MKNYAAKCKYDKRENELLMNKQTITPIFPESVTASQELGREYHVYNILSLV